MWPEDIMQIDYQMNKRELAEVSARALAEALVKQKVMLIVFLVLGASGLLQMLVSFATPGMRMDWGLSGVLFLFLAVYLLAMFAANYRHFVKAGLLDPQRIRLENGYLISGLDGSNRVPCKACSAIKVGYGVILIGTPNSSRITSYMGIPKRAFASRDMQEAFLWLLKNSSAAGEAFSNQVVLDRGGDMVFTFDLTAKRWAHIYGEAVQVLTDPSLLGPNRPWGNYLVIGIVGIYLLIRAVVREYRVTGYLYLLAFLLALAGFLLVWDRSRARKSDYQYQTMAAKGTIQNDTLGWWEVGIRPTGGYLYHNDKYTGIQWSEFCHLIDMGDTLFFFHKNKKRYFFLPKEVFGSEEAACEFYEYFDRHGMWFRVPLEKPGWNGRRIAGIVMMALAAGLTIMVTIGNLYTAVAKGVSQFADNSYYDYDMDLEAETEPFVFRREDYPNYMPLSVQIQVLESLGIEAPGEEEMRQYEQWMAEDDRYRAYIEGTPYVGILGEMGVGTYDENTDDYICHPSVYWFDFEGWDISQDYLDILEALQVMGGGDFELTDMEEDMQNANWEEGTGAILVMFRYNNHAYAFEARMMYDWIDPDIIGFFNEVLERERNPKRVWYMGDGGQGAILFYNTREWAKEFYKRTGIELEALTRSQEEPWIHTGSPER